MEELQRMLIDAVFGGAKLDCKTTDNSAGTKEHCMVGKYCVIRTYSAGVHIGTVKAVNGTEVILGDSRRIWEWTGAFSLSELSQKGITGGRISTTIPLLALTEAIEIIPTASPVEKQFKEFPAYEV